MAGVVGQAVGLLGAGQVAAPTTDLTDREVPVGHREHVDLRHVQAHLERLGLGESRQDPGQALGEQRLAGAGRTDEGRAMIASGRDLECAACRCLPDNLGEVGCRRRIARQEESPWT